jgi:uncharacterized membrane protein YhhN
MWVLVYLLLFWLFAGVFIGVRTIEEGSQQPKKSRLRRVSVILKPIPAGLAALNLFLLRPSPSIFYLLMTVGLVLCLLGDIGMDIGLIPGLGLFMCAHITFITAFLSQSFALGISPMTFLLVAIFLAFTLGYFILLMRYLTPGLGKYKIPVMIYALVISTMMVSCCLLWLTSGTPFGIIILAGAIIFVISDSLIGVREFHHKFSHPTIKVIGTYFLAIFLLSLTACVYLF